VDSPETGSRMPESKPLKWGGGNLLKKLPFHSNHCNFKSLQIPNSQFNSREMSASTDVKTLLKKRFDFRRVSGG
jgi:hypothetical protein